MAEIKQIALDRIKIDGDTQPRVRLDGDTLAEYERLMRAGSKFPPIVVFHDGTDHWLSSGFHRVLAATNAGRSKISAEVRRGTIRDARKHAASTNDSHGLRRTNEDKQKVVMWFLEDDVWKDRSNRWIAKQSLVGEHFVRTLKSSLRPRRSDAGSTRTTYKDKHGKTTTMRTKGISDAAKKRRRPNGDAGLSPDAIDPRILVLDEARSALILAIRSGPADEIALDMDLIADFILDTRKALLAVGKYKQREYKREWKKRRSATS